MHLSKTELTRYNKHIKLSEIGIQGQERLKAAKVLVIGAGGLASSVLLQLTAAGIGLIGLVDGANIEAKHLQTHFLFSETDLGASKAKTAALTLKTQNPNIQFKVAQTWVSKENVLHLLEAFDVVVDCTDHFPTHYLLNDACCIQKKPLVFSKLHQFKGQISVLNLNGGPSLRCLFPEAPKEVVNPSEAGFLCVLPSLIGCMQANEVLKIVLEIMGVLNGKLLQLNILDYALSIQEITKTEAVKISEMGNYELKIAATNSVVPSSISAEVLSKMLHENSKLKILDVREYFEWDICHIKGATNIPMNLIDECIDEVSKDVPTVVLCHHGLRSLNVIHYLETKGYTNLINLEGGIHAWASRVEQGMATY